MRTRFFIVALLSLNACVSNERMFAVVPAQLIKRVAPVYPPAVKDLGVEGYVKMRFTLSAEGTVLNPVVTESEPSIVFDLAALEAVKQLQYTPRLVDGVSQVVHGMSYRYYFELDEK